MGWRKTGTFHAPQEILVMTCDVCERDIGYEDERRPRAHYEIARLPNPGAIDLARMMVEELRPTGGGRLPRPEAPHLAFPKEIVPREHFVRALAGEDHHDPRLVDELREKAREFLGLE